VTCSTNIAGLLAAAPQSRGAQAVSDAELARQFPELGIAYALLFVAGVVADVYLLVRWALHKAERRRLGNVPAPRWSIAEVVFGGSLVLGVSIFLGVVMHLVSGGTSTSLTSLLLVQLVVQCGFVFGLGYYLRVRNVRWQEAFGFHRATLPAALGSGALFCLASAPPLVVVTFAYERVLRSLGWPITAQDIVQQFVTTTSIPTLGLLIVFAVVVAPIFEELLFRGFAYPALKERVGTVGALLLVSALFALMHAHVASAAPLFALGLALVFAYEYTGSIVAPMALHALFNATNVATLLYVRAHS